MALSPTNNAALLQEVDEAVRKERLSSIWDRFGRWIVALGVAALLAFGGWLYWGHQQDVERGENAEALLAAFDKLQQGDPGAATAGLAKLQSAGSDAYRAIAMIQQANMKAETGDLKAAATLLATVAADETLDPALRNLALIRQTAFEFDSLKPEMVIARMKPMVEAKDPPSSWFASAAELSAIAHYQLGQYAQAGALYSRIAKLPDVPKSLQARSVQMAGMLGSNATTKAAGDSAARNQTGDTAPRAAAAGQPQKAN